jgi:methionyl-tRNA formyltransferase
MTLRIAFMGTPDFAVAALNALHQAGHDIVAVYSPPPKPAGRGNKLLPSAVQRTAEQLGIETRTPKTLRDPIEQEKFAALNLDVAVVAVYSLLLPPPILQAPKFGCINIHPSLLPRWRGAAPIKRAILSGDTETGVTIMQMDAGMDTGPMLMQERMPIAPDATAETLDDELEQLGARMIIAALDALAAHKLRAVPQPEIGVTYAAKLTREDGRIDWNKPATEIEQQIRALQPWPGSFFMLNNEPVKVLSATLTAGKEGIIPGTLLDDQFTVACSPGALRLTALQRPGKNATDGASLLRGLRLPAGSTL